MVDSFNNFIKTIIAIKDSPVILLAFILIIVLVIFEIIPLQKIDDPNYLLVFNTGLIVFLSMSLGLLIDPFCKWIIKKYKLSDFYWNRVLTKEQLSFFRKVFLYKNEFILVEDPDNLPEEYRNDEIEELRKICKVLVAIKILKSLGRSTKEIDYDRNIYETSEKYIINCENEDAILLKEKIVMEKQERLLRNDDIIFSTDATNQRGETDYKIKNSGTKKNDDKYCLDCFTEWQLDFLTECIVPRHITQDEWRDCEKLIKDLELLEIIEHKSYGVVLKEKLPKEFTSLKPYLKNRLIKKNIQNNSK